MKNIIHQLIFPRSLTSMSSTMNHNVRRLTPPPPPAAATTKRTFSSYPPIFDSPSSSSSSSSSSCLHKYSPCSCTPSFSHCSEKQHNTMFLYLRPLQVGVVKGQKCRMYSSTTSIYQNIEKGNNANKDDNGDKNKNDDNFSSSTIQTTPLSEVSSNDLKLALDTSSSSSSSFATSSTSSLNLNDIPGTSTGGGNRQLAIIYTCNVCNTRSAKKFTERAYNHGVVLVRCPKCESLHLIADRLGYFSDDDDDIDSDDTNKSRKGWDIEKFMKKIGKEDNIKVVTSNDDDSGSSSSGGVLEVTIEDIVGRSDKE